MPNSPKSPKYSTQNTKKKWQLLQLILSSFGIQADDLSGNKMLIWTGQTSIQILDQKKKKKDIYLNNITVQETTGVHFLDSKKPHLCCSIQIWDMGDNTASIIATDQNLVQYSMILSDTEWKTFGFQPMSELTTEKRAIACEQLGNSLRIVSGSNKLRVEAASALRKRVSTEICGIFVLLDLWDASHGISKAYIVRVTDIETKEEYSLRIFGETCDHLSKKMKKDEPSPLFDNILLNIYFEQIHRNQLVLKLRDPLVLPEHLKAQKRLRMLRLKLKIGFKLHGANDVLNLEQLKKEGSEGKKHKKQGKRGKKKHSRKLKVPHELPMLSEQVLDATSLDSNHKYVDKEEENQEDDGANQEGAFWINNTQKILNDTDDTTKLVTTDEKNQNRSISKGKSERNRVNDQKTIMKRLSTRMERGRDNNKLKLPETQCPSSSSPLRSNTKDAIEGKRKERASKVAEMYGFTSPVKTKKNLHISPHKIEIDLVHPSKSARRPQSASYLRYELRGLSMWNRSAPPSLLRKELRDGTLMKAAAVEPVPHTTTVLHRSGNFSTQPGSSPQSPKLYFDNHDDDSLYHNSATPVESQVHLSADGGCSRGDRGNKDEYIFQEREEEEVKAAPIVQSVMREENEETTSRAGLNGESGSNYDGDSSSSSDASFLDHPTTTVLPFAIRSPPDNFRKQFVNPMSDSIVGEKADTKSPPDHHRASVKPVFDTTIHHDDSVVIDRKRERELRKTLSVNW